MADIVSVENEDRFVQEITSNDDLDTTPEGARVLWEIWTHRHENGATDDVLVALPGWFAQEEFDCRWPFLFAQIEYDDEDKGAVLFKDARLVDVNIIENDMWGQTSMSKTLTTVDQTESNEYIDEVGLVWIPRSLSTLYGR